MKIYTKTGDKGTTSLVGGTRISKSSIRLDAYGTIDELNSWIGFIRSFGIEDKQTDNFLEKLQNSLFNLGADLATEMDVNSDVAAKFVYPIELTESEIDRMDALLPALQNFVLPGGCKSASATHIARTVCRRAERIMVSLPVDCYPNQREAISFVNRLSDYLFVLARYLNFQENTPETYWQK